MVHTERALTAAWLTETSRPKIQPLLNLIIGSRTNRYKYVHWEKSAPYAYKLQILSVAQLTGVAAIEVADDDGHVHPLVAAWLCCTVVDNLDFLSLYNAFKSHPYFATPDTSAEDSAVAAAHSSARVPAAQQELHEARQSLEQLKQRMAAEAVEHDERMRQFKNEADIKLEKSKNAAIADMEQAKIDAAAKLNATKRQMALDAASDEAELKKRLLHVASEHEKLMAAIERQRQWSLSITPMPGETPIGTVQRLLTDNVNHPNLAPVVGAIQHDTTLARHDLGKATFPHDLLLHNTLRPYYGEYPMPVNEVYDEFSRNIRIVHDIKRFNSSTARADALQASFRTLIGAGGLPDTTVVVRELARQCNLCTAFQHLQREVHGLSDVGTCYQDVPLEWVYFHLLQIDFMCNRYCKLDESATPRLRVVLNAMMKIPAIVAYDALEMHRQWLEKLPDLGEWGDPASPVYRDWLAAIPKMASQRECGMGRTELRQYKKRREEV